MSGRLWSLSPCWMEFPLTVTPSLTSTKPPWPGIGGRERLWHSVWPRWLTSSFMTVTSSTSTSLLSSIEVALVFVLTVPSVGENEAGLACAGQVKLLLTTILGRYAPLILAPVESLALGELFGLLVLKIIILISLMGCSYNDKILFLLGGRVELAVQCTIGQGLYWAQNWVLCT